MDDLNTVSIPSHQPGDWIVIWTAPKKPRRWRRFWDRGKTHLVATTEPPIPCPTDQQEQSGD